MHYIIYLSSFILFQITSSQIISNTMQNLAANSRAMAYANANGLASSSLPLLSRMSSGMPNANLVGNIGNSVNNEIMATNLGNTFERSYSAANMNSLNPNMANLLPVANMANGWNSNMANTFESENLNSLNPSLATFNFGNSGNPFTVTSGSPGIQDFGIKVLADALEIGGTIAVRGRMPLYGVVALNGQLPTDGAASVIYSCGGSYNP